MSKGIPGRGQLLRTAAAFGIASGVANVYDQQKTGFGSYNVGSIAKSAMMGAMSGASFSYGGKGRGRMSRSLMGLASGTIAGAGMSDSQRGGAMQGAILGLGFGAGGGRLLKGTNVPGLIGPSLRAARTGWQSLGSNLNVMRQAGTYGSAKAWGTTAKVVGGSMRYDFRSAQGMVGAELGLRMGQAGAGISGAAQRAAARWTNYSVSRRLGG